MHGGRRCHRLLRAHAKRNHVPGSGCVYARMHAFVYKCIHVPSIKFSISVSFLDICAIFDGVFTFNRHHSISISSSNPLRPLSQCMCVWIHVPSTSVSFLDTQYGQVLWTLRDPRHPRILGCGRLQRFAERPKLLSNFSFSGNFVPVGQFFFANPQIRLVSFLDLGIARTVNNSKTSRSQPTRIPCPRPQ